ncbi:MAG: penicillin-binding protein [Fimbriimonadales bacterium]|nr:MAG: penicillin-binding protein [Fimbriimonadales bacterium]
MGAGFLLAGAQHVRLASVLRADRLRIAEANDQLTHRDTIPAQRGTILDHNGSVLARTEEAYHVTITPKLLTDSRAFWVRASEVLGIPADQGIALARSGRGGLDFPEKIDRERRKRLLELCRTFRVDGIGFVPTGERTYPAGPSAATVIGFLKDGVPASGLEKGLNETLRGEDGVQVGFIDRNGSVIPWLRDEGLSREVQHGADVVLTLDRDLQAFASERLAEVCEYHGAWQGVAIVLESHTGNVRALATWPTFDPTDPLPALQRAQKGETASPEINPAVSVLLEPGSTFKSFTVALGLESGALTPNSSISCKGSIPVGSHVIHCALHGSPGHGAVDPARCIEVSCNVAAATWGMAIGKERWYDFLKRSGLLEKPDVGLPGALSGQFNWNEYDKRIQIATLGFGQSITVTPLQLASLFTAFANDGVAVHPRLIEKVGSSRVQVRPGVPLFRAETARTVLQMMKAVVQGEHGTGRALRIEGVEIAGKSGTAQKRDPKTGRMSNSLYVSSFVGYVSADSPEYTVLVMVDSPKKNGYYGAAVAGPVFRAIAEYLLKSGMVRGQG